MNALISSPSVLLHHDGELSDIAQLLEQLGAHYHERIGPLVKGADGSGFDIVFATPRRILHFGSQRSASTTTLIAVLEGESKRLRSHLRRISVDLMITRPVHPAALRLLMLHTLYRGPERRNRKRVSIGSWIRFRTALRPRSAMLTDFSTRGCRLLTRVPVARDTKLKLTLPGHVTGGGKLKLNGVVIRSGPAIDEEGGYHVLAVRFQEVTAALLRRLQSILDLHSTGPARLAEPMTRGGRAGPAATPARQAPALSEVELDAYPSHDDSTSTELDTAPETTPDTSSERRMGNRHSYEKRVVALGEQATRVLLGRDISKGGMRVDAASGLGPDESLQIALHASGRNEPLVLQARVLRDDGPDGLVLRFEELDDDATKVLEDLIAHLPVQTPYGEEADAGIVISEIVDRKTGQW